jgi:hypothetical protein
MPVPKRIKQIFVAFSCGTRIGVNLTPWVKGRIKLESPFYEAVPSSKHSKKASSPSTLNLVLIPSFCCILQKTLILDCSESFLPITSAYTDSPVSKPRSTVFLRGYFLPATLLTTQSMIPTDALCQRNCWEVHVNLKRLDLSRI